MKPKSKSFLSKYQLGGDVDDTIQQNPYEYAPNLQAAQQIVQFNQPKSQMAYTPTQQGFDFGQALPLIGPAINLGIGVKNIIDSFGQRKRQKQYERAYQKDLNRRMEESRTNDYYHTPYEFEEGGSIPDRYKNMGFNRVGQKKESSRDGKKWMVLAKKGNDYKVVHGGYEGMKDFTQHKDEDRRERFWDRMGGKDSAKANDKFSPLYWHKRFGTWQQGGQFDQMYQMNDFMNYYNQKEGQNQMMQQQFEDYYNQKNEFYENRWKTNLNQGIQSTLNSALSFFQQGGFTEEQDSNYQKLMGRDTIKHTGIETDKAIDLYNTAKKDTTKLKDYYKTVSGADTEKTQMPKVKRFDKWRHEMQEGGEYNPKTDLYSSEYDPNEFLGVAKNEVEIAQQEDQEQSLLSSWLFEDDDPYQEQITDQYFSNQSIQSNSLNVLDKIKAQESGGNPEAINPTTNASGYYQFVPKYWAGQIKSFMGLPNTYTTEQVMETFRKNPTTQDQFMQHVHENIYQPEIERLRPLAQKYRLTDDKLERMLHYRGIADTKRRLQTGDFSVSQAEKDKYKNPDILQYLNK